MKPLFRRIFGTPDAPENSRPEATSWPEIDHLEPRMLFSAAPVEAPAAEADPESQEQTAEESVVVSQDAARAAAGSIESVESAQEGVVAESTLSGQFGISAGQNVNLVNLNPGVEEVHRETLEAVAEAAAERWRATGLTAEQSAALDGIEYAVEDLGGTHLGFAEGNRITLDDNAAGNLWFIDPTPLVDEEYTAESDTLLTANSGTFAYGKTDLLTVIMHEQGNLLGLEDVSAGTGNVMLGVLGYNDRVLPAEGQAEGALLGAVESSYLDSGVAGSGQPFDNVQPSLGINYIVNVTGGTFPSPSGAGDTFLGEVRQFGGNFAPGGWALADGTLVPITSNPALFSLFGTTYGGDGESTFALPDLRGRTAVHVGEGIALGQSVGTDEVTLTEAQLAAHTHTTTGADTGNTGGGQAFDNRQPSLGVNFIVNVTGGTFPSESGAGATFLGEVRQFGGNFEPGGWKFADGTLLPIASNPALFSLFGTTYGGDGETTFALPDLRGRTAVHVGQGIALGESVGTDEVTLTEAQLAGHTHTLPVGSSGSIGGGQAFDNVQPSRALNYIVATQGHTFPHEGGAGDTFLGEVRQFGGNFAPGGWKFADGTLLPISSNPALFSIFGTTYGGDGESTFALPDLRGRAAVHVGGGIALGQSVGTDEVTLTEAQLVAHSHEVIAPVNTDPTQNANTGLTVDEASTGNVVGQAQLEFTDAEEGAVAIIYTLDTVPANGTLKLKTLSGGCEQCGRSPLFVGGTFTQDDINNNRVTYDHDGTETTGDSIQFDVTDRAGGASNDVTFSFTISPQNDPPSFSINEVLTVDEGGSGTIATANLNEYDPDDSGAELTYTVTALPGNGSVKLGGSALAVNGTFTQVDIDANNLTYEHDGSETTSDSFDLSLADGGENGSTPATYTLNLTITPQNDTPAIFTNAGLTVLEGASGTIGTAQLNENDPDDSGADLTYAVTALPSNGSVKKNGTALLLNGTFTQADIDANLVTYEHNGSETTSDSFNFSLADGLEDGAAAAPGTFNLTITPQNDSPAILTNAGLTVNQGASGTIGTAQLTENDPDDSGAGLTYTVTALPSNGSLKLSGSALALNGTFTQADIDANNVTYDHNGAEPAVESFDFSLADGGENGASAVTGTFTITVNDVTPPTPNITGPGALTNNDPFSVTIDFGETVNNFVSGDVTVTGGSVSSFTDNNDGTFTVGIDATADGAVNVSVAANVATDDAGNNNGVSNNFNVTVDTTGPTPNITGPTGPTNSDPFNVTIDFGETVNDFVQGDVTVTGGSVSSFTDNNNGTFTVGIDATADGAVTVSVAANVATDATDNNNSASNNFNVTVDTTGPTPNITGPASPTNSDPFNVTIDFGETVNDFVQGDVTVTNGSVSSFTDNTDGTFTVGIDATADGAISVSVAASVATDAGGNNNNVSNTFNVTVDSAGPTPTLSGPAGPLTDLTPFDVTIDFGETMTGFVLGDITVGNGSVTNFTDNTGGSFTAEITPVAGGNLTVDVAAGVATEGAGNGNNAAVQYLVTLNLPLGANTAQVTGTDLEIKAGSSGDTVTLSSDGTNLRINTPGGTINAGAGTTSSGTDVLVPIAGLTSITLNTGDDDDVINISDLTNFNGSLTIDGGDGKDDIVQTGDVEVTGASTVDYTAEEIVLKSGAKVSTDTGDVTMSGTGATGNATGIKMSGAEISSTSGNVNLTGQGGDTGHFNKGIELTLDLVASVDSTITTGGEINLVGTGGTSGAFGSGVVVTSSTLTATGGGEVNITGGGGGGSFFNEGVTIQSGATIDAGTGDLTIAGTGSDEGLANRGIKASGSELKSDGGNISLSGIGGGPTVLGIGADLNSMIVSTTGTGTVTITGSGADGTVLNMGVKISGTSTIDSVDGEIRIEGTANGVAALNHGVQMATGTDIESTGGGAIIVKGSGGTGGINHGIELASNVKLTVKDGNIEVTGTGGATGAGNVGVKLSSTTFTGNGAGNIILLGSSNGTGSGNKGILGSGAIFDTNTTEGAGTITIKGTGSANGTTFNEGVKLTGGSITTGANKAIDIDGTGGGKDGATNSSNMGVSFGTGLNINAGSGAITIDGTGGKGSSSNIGIQMTGTTVETTGLLTIVGTGSTTSTTTTVYNYGLNLYTNVTLNGGAGSTITGTGGTGTVLNHGIRAFTPITTNLDKNTDYIGTAGTGGTDTNGTFFT